MKTPRFWIACCVITLVLCVSSRSNAQSHDTLTPIPVLLSTLDSNPDILHNDFTPSVFGLCAHGLPGARAAATLLNATNEMTRLHAIRAVECAVSRHFGLNNHDDADHTTGTRQFQELLVALGSYDWHAPAPARIASSRLWENWLRLHEHDTPIPPDHPGASAVRSALSRTNTALRTCLRSQPRAPSSITVRITFGSDGTTRSAQVLSRLNPSVESCLVRTLLTTSVPRFTASTFQLQAAISL